MRLIHFVFRGGLFKFKLRSNLKKKKKYKCLQMNKILRTEHIGKRKKNGFQFDSRMP